MKLPCEKEAPPMYCMECSLLKTTTLGLRAILRDNDEEEVLKRCGKCGFHDI